MLTRPLHSTICASCRLRSSIAVKQLARTRGKRWTSPLSSVYRSLPGVLLHQGTYRGFVAAAVRRRGGGTSIARAPKDELDGTDAHEDVALSKEVEVESLDLVQAVEEGLPITPEEAALRARRAFGDALPEGLLGEEALAVYERLYGRPVRYAKEVEDDEEFDGGVALDGTGVLKEDGEGGLVEVEFDERDVEGEEAVEEDEMGEEAVEAFEKRDVMGGGVAGHEADAALADDINRALDGLGGEEARQHSLEAKAGSEPFVRTHPLTAMNRFGTSPASLPLPRQTLIEPIERHLASTSNIHLSQAAERAFGGVGLPYSTSTPGLGRSMPSKPIGLDASQNRMTDTDADVFLATLVPGMYASIMSVLTETRKRLGTAWAEAMVEKATKGELRILDAGGAGAGVFAVREMFRAEWERMHEERAEDEGPGFAMATPVGKLGGASASPPLGTATVLTGSDTLRKRASKLLEDTTFIPRLPDYSHTEEARKRGKFDIVIAPHTLYPLKENHVRRSHLQNLWSMLSQDGGVLLLLEKGIPRGFEIIAAARSYLLESHIASPDPENAESETQRLGALPVEKEKGMIIAPCTNHIACPMYQPQGVVKGRRDICHFSQRYVRPSFLQKILHAKEKNWEDVEFSYISIMRGRDLRDQDSEAVVQGIPATARAFDGYGIDTGDATGEPGIEIPHSLSLPRAVLPPLKRTGHVILDLCTPAGTLERWTVPRSFSKQAYKDARKSSWGDLWALGAKTRVSRVAKIKKRSGGGNTVVVEKKVKGGLSYDDYGRVVAVKAGLEGNGAGVSDGPDGGTSSSGSEALKGQTRGRRVKGVRDKRDKRGDGNGRRKSQDQM